MAERIRRLLLPIVFVAALAACSSSKGTGDAISPAPQSDPACPAGDAPVRWPAVVPADMPRLPGLQIVHQERQGSSTAISFTAVGTIKQTAVFFASRLPEAGFALRGGDSEEDEVDQPFSGHDRSGAFKVHSTSGCAVQGVLVISR